MKFLIIGASSFVGKHTLSYIKSLGYDVIGTQSGTRKKYPGLVTFNLLEDNIKDCLKPAFFKGKESVYAIIFAAIARVDECFKHKEISYKINVEKTIRLLKDLKELGIKPVFISTSFVFGGDIGYYTEKHKQNPVCVYGRHKQIVEEFIKKNMPDTLIFRLDKIIGDDPAEEHLLTEWYRLIEQKKTILCMKGQIFSPTFVNDIAKAVVLGCKKNLSGIYHIANSEFFSREELAKQFALALNKKADIVSKTQKEIKLLDMRPLKSYLDSTKFIKATGMRFTTMRGVFNNFINKLEE